jgi:hypothetical protein
VSFLAAVTIPTTGSPNESVVVGDFNGDGKPDVATVVYTENSDRADYASGIWIGTSLSNGNGTFQPMVLTSLPSDAAGLLAGDVNADGKAELISLASNTLTTWLSNGDGTFTAGQSTSWSTSTEGYWPSSARILDVNGDGKPDIVLQDDEEGGSAVLAFLGNGDGTFQTAISAPLDNYNRYGVLADLNADGKLDVVGVDQSSGELEIFLSTADGYAPHVLYPTASGATFPYWYAQISVADLNNDGRPDVVLMEPYSNESYGGNAYVYMNQGNGIFAPGVGYWTGFYSDAATVADVNGDGKADLIVSNDDSADITVLLGNGDGSFVTPTAGYAVGGYPWGPAVVADFNGDSKPDLVVSDDEMNIIYLQNLGDGTFAAAADYYAENSATVSDYGYGLAVAIGDLNGDGRPDVVLGRESTSYDPGVSVFLANADGTFQPGVSYGDSRFMDYAAIGDFTGDGVPDVLAIDTGSSSLDVFAGNGDGTFSTTPVNYPVPGGDPQNLIVGDFNRDGKLDVAIADYNGYVDIMINNGDGTVTSSTYSLDDSAENIAMGDFNGDGNLDLAAAEYYNNTIAVLLGDGTGVFQVSEIPLNIATSGEPYAIAVGDLNGDGKADLAFTLNSPDSNEMQYVGVMTGNGDGTFNAALIFPATTKNTVIERPWPGGISIADVNNDGKADLVYTNSEYGTVAILYNQGNDASNKPLFYNPVEFASGGYVYGISTADLNGDGGVDYVAAGNDFPGITVGYNTAGSAVTVTSSKNPSNSVDAITISGQVKAMVHGTITTPTGTVIVTEGSETMGTGNLTSGTGAVQMPALTAGTHTLNVVYSGDNSFFGRSATLSQVVQPTDVNVSVVSSKNPAMQADRVTLAATVASAGGGTLTPTGTVTFSEGSTTLGRVTLSQGSGSILLSNLSLGTHTYNAQYSGDEYFAAGAHTLAQVVAVPYGVEPDRTSATITAGQSATFTLTVTPNAGFSDAVSFTCGSLPQGMTCAFAPHSVTPTDGAATTRLTIQTTGASTTASRQKAGKANVLWASFLSFGVFGMMVLGAGFRRKEYCIALTILAILLLTGIVGCGSSSHLVTANPNATPPGQYAVRVTAASSAYSAPAMTLNVTVQ